MKDIIGFKFLFLAFLIFYLFYQEQVKAQLYKEYLTEQEKKNVKLIKAGYINSQPLVNSPDVIEFYIKDDMISVQTYLTDIDLITSPLEIKIEKLCKFASSNLVINKTPNTLYNLPFELKNDFSVYKSNMKGELNSNKKVSKAIAEREKALKTNNEINKALDSFLDNFNENQDLRDFLLKDSSSIHFIEFPASLIRMKDTKIEVKLNTYINELENFNLRNEEKLAVNEYVINEFFGKKIENFKHKVQKTEKILIQNYQLKRFIDEKQTQIFEAQKGESEYTIMLGRFLKLTQKIDNLKGLINEKITKPENKDIINNIIVQLTNENNQLTQELPKKFGENNVISQKREIRSATRERFKIVKKFCDDFVLNYSYNQGFQYYFKTSELKFINIIDTTVLYITLRNKKIAINEENLFEVIKNDLKETFKVFSEANKIIVDETSTFETSIGSRLSGFEGKIEDSKKQIELLHLKEIIQDKEKSIHSVFFPENKGKPIKKRIYTAGVTLLAEKLKSETDSISTVDDKINKSNEIISLYTKLITLAGQEKEQSKELEKRLKDPIEERNFNEIIKLLEYK